ncbi:MAG: hypothetical protein CL840_11835 [Crocinitomicaceae bacterium]|nr:hypothetical protein [Crocinitomicaceae bacterium]|tara:strand:- start:5139 stop:5642 length:504 start_codon:yes stop_codon:yes gene_type:complete
MKSILKLVVFSLLISSCGDPGSATDAKEAPAAESVEETAPTKTESTKQPDDLLQFNDGQKWLANPETSEGMLMMQVIIKGFYETHEDNRNYAELTGELQYQCNYIIKNCTMKGEAHEQLHAVLHPILENVTAAQNAASYEDADASIKKIDELIAQYLRYFDVEEVPA